MPVDLTVDRAVDVVDNKTRAVQLRAQGLTLQQIGTELGMSKQGVAKLLATSGMANLPAARMESAARTLTELAEATRSAAADVFKMGVERAQRRMREVGESKDDHAAKTILETAKISTEGAKIVHGWGDQAGNAGGLVSIGIINALRDMKPSQIIEAETVPNTIEELSDSNSHQIKPNQAENQ
jgi:hypothetical protein